MEDRCGVRLSFCSKVTDSCQLPDAGRHVALLSAAQVLGVLDEVLALDAVHGVRKLDNEVHQLVGLGAFLELRTQKPRETSRV